MARAKKYPDTAWGRMREAKGYSLRQLAALSGVNHVVISHIENGRMVPRPDEAIALAKALA